MKDLYNAGRVFFALALVEMGVQMVWCKAYPYMLLPANYGLPWLAYVLGIIFAAGGLCLLFQLKPRLNAVLLGILFLLIFVCYYIPYELFADPNYKQFAEWENAAKELAFAGGAFALAASYVAKSGKGFLAKLVVAGNYIYAIPILYFGILHFVVAKEASGYVPSWIPWHLFWMYFCGTALIGGAMSIILRVKV